MMNEIEIPVELRSVLADLQGTFRPVEENPDIFRTGEIIIKECFGGGDSWVNVIPGGIPGTCHPTLVVAIGAHDSANIIRIRLLEAQQHVNGDCKGRTNSIVFYAMWWDLTQWARERARFRSWGIPCVLMMPFARPQLLR